ncbi:glyoxalase/bleomycin resistance/dioxygenase family protein [Rathayibacter tritici]|uniref:Glyoxalase n=1 Tax=Rathayibacter tritici TaxID=33888 RepID=A0A160KR06_9MICO|nr:VOC family protein [Rathayibacter tritici]AND16016.1 glyoxalase [Rathayibacter tritici]PPF29961.1 glyoxalase/bleomycin resistance/dioxygenase family protein [Rathayibacter tritici]PPF68656.1 glyoxalase/bleomycin resistance/dioxygenase family protein [Rathayibacter tritici]PPG07378.1 glyoxalase/bleomycin resistance/dioxygenase family protein [Rathayibacter tritici]PPI11992.1 glyoxalase/bleomycin resistance/dioxygenase family protein [Rathayibacter tritici]
MIRSERAFSGFSVDDVAAARAFYGGVLGLEVEVNAVGVLQIELPGGGRAIAYPKPDHEPASFTILNFSVEDVDAAVAELNAAGVITAIYDDPALPTDATGVMRGHGPTICWFRDPAGNVLSVIEGG